MPIVRILQYPDIRLKKKAKWIEEVNDEVRKVVSDMFETHYNAENCAALAALLGELPAIEAATRAVAFAEDAHFPAEPIEPELALEIDEVVLVLALIGWLVAKYYGYHFVWKWPLFIR